MILMLRCCVADNQDNHHDDCDTMFKLIAGMILSPKNDTGASLPRAQAACFPDSRLYIYIYIYTYIYIYIHICIYIYIYVCIYIYIYIFMCVCVRVSVCRSLFI